MEWESGPLAPRRVMSGPNSAWLAATFTVGRLPVTIVAGVMGLIVGSFLNVVVYRVPLHLSVASPPSFCPRCHAHVGAIENVPILSWLALRGRCRHCGEPISPRYPLVEAITGALFALLGWVIGPHWAVLGCCVLAATVLALATIAVDGPAPPMSIALIGGGIGTALLVVAGAADHRWPRLVASLIGIATGALVMAVIALVLHTTHQDGDIRAMAVALPVGALVGWVGPLGAGVGAAGAVIALVAISLWERTRKRHAHLTASVVLALAAGAAIGVTVAAALGRVTGT